MKQLLSFITAPSPDRTPVALLITAYVAIFGGILVATDFLPYVMDGNETFSSLWHAANLYRFGLAESWGLADEAFSPHSAAHPYVHTHQGNFPRMLAFLLYAVGSRTAESQIAITTFSVGIAGILFVYFFFARIATPWFGFTVCIIFITDYLLFAQWQVVTYRVWHVFLLFGCLLSVAKLSEQGTRGWWLTTLALFTCLFYFELIFAAFVGGLCGLYAIARTFRQPARLATIVAAQGLGAIAAVSTVLLQGSGYLGAENLRRDLYLTFLARNDFSSASGLLEAAATFYERHNVIFWHNIQESEQFGTLSAFFRSVTRFDWQVHTPVFSMAVWIVVGGWLLSFLQRRSSDRSSTGLRIALALAIFSLGALSFFHGASPSSAGAHWVVIAALTASATTVSWLLASDTARHDAITEGNALAIMGAGVFMGGVGVLVPLSGSLFDQTYRPLWEELQGWLGVFSGGGVILFLATAVAGYVTISGARRVFGSSRERRLLYVLLYLVCGAGAYAVVYKLSAGYIYSGYLVRNAPFTVFLTDVVVACAIYIAVMAARRTVIDLRPLQREIPWQGVFRAYAQRSLAIATSLFVLLLVGSWAAVQIYYVYWLPPTHYAFLKILEAPPYRGASFVVDNYAAPVAAYTGEWAYMDPIISQAIVESERGKRVLVGDQRYLWFADRESNSAYRRPEYFVCMVPQSLPSLLARILRDRGEGPGHPGCAARPLVRIAKTGQAASTGFELTDIDRTGEARIGFDSWAIVKLPLGAEKDGLTLDWRRARNTGVGSKGGD